MRNKKDLLRKIRLDEGNHAAKHKRGKRNKHETFHDVEWKRLSSHPKTGKVELIMTRNDT